LPAIPVRDEYDRNKGNKQRESNWRVWTLTGEYFFHKNARATVTYQWRDVGADERTAVARINGNAVLNGVEQRLGIQLTLLFNRIVMQ
jgi:predicted porin